MPISHMTGRNTSANSSCSVTPPRNRPRIMLTSDTTATVTKSTVTMPTSGAMPSLVPQYQRIESAGRLLADADLGVVVARPERHHQRRNRERRRRAYHRADQDVSQRVRDDWAQHCRIDHHHGAGD